MWSQTCKWRVRRNGRYHIPDVKPHRFHIPERPLGYEKKKKSVFGHREVLCNIILLIELSNPNTKNMG